MWRQRDLQCGLRLYVFEICRNIKAAILCIGSGTCEKHSSGLARALHLQQIQQHKTCAIPLVKNAKPTTNRGRRAAQPVRAGLLETHLQLLSLIYNIFSPHQLSRRPVLSTVCPVSPRFMRWIFFNRGLGSNSQHSLPQLASFDRILFAYSRRRAFRDGKKEDKKKKTCLFIFTEIRTNDLPSTGTLESPADNTKLIHWATVSNEGWLQ